jgi:hypothetical protein
LIVLLSLEIKAHFVLGLKHIEISSAGSTRGALIGGSVVQAGDVVSVRVATLDVEGLPIFITDAFLEVAFADPKLRSLFDAVSLKQDTAHPAVHKADLPRDWFMGIGGYDLILTSKLNASVPFVVEVESQLTYLAVPFAASAAILLVLLGLLFLVLLKSPYRTRDDMKLQVKSFLAFEIYIWFVCTSEMVDLVLDTLSLLAVTRDSGAQWLVFANTAVFGCSTVASVCSLIALFRLLIIRLRMRLSMYETCLRALSDLLIAGAMSHIGMLQDSKRWEAPAVADVGTAP